MFVERIKLVMSEHEVSVTELAIALDVNAAELLRQLDDAYMFWFNFDECCDRYKKIAKALNCSLDYLFGLSDCINPIGA